MKEKYGFYLICKEHINDVRKFLGQFYKEKKDKYSARDWITFKLLDSDFLINLMIGKDQKLTRNMTFEIYFDSMKGLEDFARKHRCKIKSFKVTNTNQKYIYNYAEIAGPRNICKIEASYCEDIK